MEEPFFLCRNVVNDPNQKHKYPLKIVNIIPFPLKIFYKFGRLQNFVYLCPNQTTTHTHL